MEGISEEQDERSGVKMMCVFVTEWTRAIRMRIEWRGEDGKGGDVAAKISCSVITTSTTGESEPELGLGHGSYQATTTTGR